MRLIAAILQQPVSLYNLISNKSIMKQLRIFLFALTAYAVFACTNAPTPQKGNEALVRRDIYNDNVKIAYNDTGNGDTTLFFIHGWNINKGYWSNQLEFFKQRYRVVTIDLPGFGASGHNRQNWSVENYGKDITAVIDSPGLQHIVLIGHSMSGAIAVEAALQNPGKVIAVVGIDNFTDVGYMPSAKDLQSYAAVYESMRKNYTGEVTAYSNKYLFAPSTDSVVRQRVINDFVHADSTTSLAILEENDRYPLTKKLKELNKRVYLINSNWHPTDTVGFIKNNIAYKLMYIGSTGHYPMIEKPSEFNVLLQQVIDSIGK
jgi:pimeloyl-ACP methyl ester carboxylesterase